MGPPARAIAALTGSVLLHAGATGIYLMSHALDQPPQQSPPQSQFEMDTVAAPRQRAQEQTPPSADAEEKQTESALLGAGAVPASRAKDLGLTAERSAAQSPRSAKAEDIEVGARPVPLTSPSATDVSAAVPASAPETQSVAELAPEPDRAEPQSAPISTAVEAAETSPVKIAGLSLPADPAQSAPLAAKPVETADVPTERATSVLPEPSDALVQTPPSAAIAAGDAFGTKVKTTVPTGAALAQTDLPATCLLYTSPSPRDA